MPYRFTQPCPTCGRHVRVAVELLGREVACQHCHAQFVAGSDNQTNADVLRQQPLLERVDQILQQVDRRRDSFKMVSP